MPHGGFDITMDTNHNQGNGNGIRTISERMEMEAKYGEINYGYTPNETTNGSVKNGAVHVHVHATPPEVTSVELERGTERATRPGRTSSCPCCISCTGCRQWGECCSDVCSEIKAGCSRCDCKGHLRKCCSVKKVKQKLPITKWLPKYRLVTFTMFTMFTLLSLQFSENIFW